ncbi:Oligopeptide transport system permease protein OppB (TC 3.A.1.5.1) [hydrothermal vent metagenome]|uniref:Oligopeptide transport system permease protein OppB (TC 3.A.1.5.1) n=1 Tax=hydrothermal vent metagenome TaxID=652676 RepID=A0A3B1DVV4_9ZZZZ
MLSYVIRRILYNIPIYLVIVLVVMAMLRINDPVTAYLSKNPTEQERKLKEQELGLDRPFLVQYVTMLKSIATFDYSAKSWYQETNTVGEVIGPSILPSLKITLPALTISTLLSVCIGLVAAVNRGRMIDRGLMFFAVVGMSVSFLVFIILGQYFGAFWLTDKLGTEIFSIRYEPSRLTGNFFADWIKFYSLPVLISVIVSVGYDTRFYRSVIVEQTTADYIRTARAKGCSQRRVMFKHLLRNALIPIITRVMITLPFLIVGSLLLEVYFSIPGMGRTLLTHMTNKDFAVTQTIVALLAAIFILSNILTDVLYAIVDPRVRLS